MPLSRNNLYRLLAAGCLAGYSWLFFQQAMPADRERGLGVCLIKKLTNIPCPSCGTTRAILSLLKGDFLFALYWNPLGIFLFTILLILPFWLVYDLLFRKETLLQFYRRCESIIRQRRVAIPLSLLVLGNWIWNIYKGL